MRVFRKILKTVFVCAVIACLLGLCTVFVMGVQLLNASSDVKFDKTKLLEVYAKTAVYDSAGELLDKQPYSNRLTAKLDQIPQYTKDAFTSIEDKRFYKHHGLDYARMAKALLHNVTSGGKSLQGASTISQQLIKNTHLTNERTFTRKLREMVLTKKLEKQFSKDDILETYLNVIYFGNNSYGIESAAQNYFDKSAKDLTLAESATLAGMIKSPNFYSPVSNYDRCLARRNLVLSEMLKDKKITQKEFDEAKASSVKISDNNLKALEQRNVYASSAIAESEKLLNMSERDIILSGVKIYTYLDKNVSDSVAESLKNKNYQPDGYVPDTAVVVIDNKTGGITALSSKGIADVNTLKRQS